MLVKSVTAMTLALIFYTWAVFSGRKEGLHRKHLLIFALGLLFDFLHQAQGDVVKLDVEGDVVYLSSTLQPP